MKVLVTGASGLIGQALAAVLKNEGGGVVRLVRTGARPAGDDVSWDPEAGLIDVGRLEGFDAVVHLAGENIAGGSWTPERKRRIRESRVKGTRLLCEALAGLDRPPEVLASASAVGYYGDRGGDLLREESPPGTGFLAQVCGEWEAATGPASRSGIRVVRLRIGMVLSAAGGALARMLPLFRAGLGGRLGSGRQYVSWIALDDVVGAIRFSLTEPSIEGPLNVVAPGAVTNREFTKILARVLGRPALLPAPAFALRMAFGGMADELLLASARVEPSRLAAAAYRFLHPELEGALRNLLGR